jgi:ABC-type uncharacterized transport system substrate-binding protein
MKTLDCSRGATGPMRRRELALALGAAAITWPLALRAQPKAAVVGLISGRAPGEIPPAVLAAFRKGLSQEGYVEGRNVTIDYRWAQGHIDRYPALAADLVARKVNVIVTLGGPAAARAAEKATSTIPVVFWTGDDPVADGLVPTLARPGGNLTGIAGEIAEMIPKRLELLTELAPRTGVVGLLVNPGQGLAPSGVREAEEAARAKGIRLVVLKVGAAGGIEAAFRRLAGLRDAGLIVAADAFLFARHKQIVALAARYRIPAIYPEPEFADSGGLITYAPNFLAAFRQVAAYAGRILKGAKPADLPVQQPTEFDLTINLRTAKALGLSIPPSLLALAAKVIE